MKGEKSDEKCSKIELDLGEFWSIENVKERHVFGFTNGTCSDWGGQFES